MAPSEHNPFRSDPFADSSNPYAAPESMEPAIDISGQAFASRSARLGGAILDGLILMPLNYGAMFVMYNLGIFKPVANPFAQFGTQAVQSLAMFPIGVGFFLLVNGYLLKTRGQTVGKLAAGTKIVSRDDGQILPLAPLVIKRTIIMGLICLIPVVGGFIALADALAIFRGNHQCLHDDIAGTKVVKVN